MRREIVNLAIATADGAHMFPVSAMTYRGLAVHRGVNFDSMRKKIESLNGVWHVTHINSGRCLDIPGTIESYKHARHIAEKMGDLVDFTGTEGETATAIQRVYDEGRNLQKEVFEIVKSFYAEEGE